MAASNMLEKLDKALLRPGRFDRQVFVPPPDMQRPRNGSSRSTRATSRWARTSTSTGSPATPRASPAPTSPTSPTRRRSRPAAQQARLHRPDRLRQRLRARRRRACSRARVITDQEKRVVAWHEAGHALVSELLPSVDKVQKVSIVPRGKALGYTLNLPQEDRYLKSRGELIDYMKVLLAGRVSEQITFGRITTGASDDLKRVTIDRPLDGLRVRDGDHDPLPSGAGRRLHGLGVPAPDPRRGGAGDLRGGLPRRARAAHRPPRPARRDRRAAAAQRGARERRDPGDHRHEARPKRARDRRCSTSSELGQPAEALASEPRPSPTGDESTSLGACSG